VPRRHLRGSVRVVGKHLITRDTRLERTWDPMDTTSADTCCADAPVPDRPLAGGGPGLHQFLHAILPEDLGANPQRGVRDPTCAAR
jgi:hypothetical protein